MTLWAKNKALKRSITQHKKLEKLRSQNLPSHLEYKRLFDIIGV